MSTMNPNLNPVVVYEMTDGMAGDDGKAYALGGRFRIETIHEDAFYAKTDVAVDQWVERHGCVGVHPGKMEQLRAERKEQSKRRR